MKKPKSNCDNDCNDDSCIGCQIGLTLYSNDTTCAECLTPSAKPKGRLFCLLCSKFVQGDFIWTQLHALQHCPQSAFSCSLCYYSTCSAKLIQSHVKSTHKDHKLNIKSLVNFNWSKLDWRSMWSNLCTLCFSKTHVNNQFDKVANIPTYERTCCLCLSQVAGGYDVLLDHTVKHLSCPKFACLYCEYESDKEHSVEEHVKSQHVSLLPMSRMDITQESVEERGRLLALCFPDIKPPPWASTSNFSTPIAAVVLCKLCHETLPFNEHECLRHVETHVNDPIFQCHFCHYKDTDVDRMKSHAQRLHHSPLYSKLTLDNELAAKFTQLTNFCFA